MKKDTSELFSQGQEILKDLEILLEKKYCESNSKKQTKELKKFVQILEKTNREIHKRKELKIS